MQFPNAAKGLKRIFTAEIIKLISVVVTIIGVALMIITLAANQAKAEGMTIAAGTGTVILLAAAAVLAVVGGIMALVGIINAMKDESSFKIALIAIIVSLCAAIVGGIFSQNATLQSICQIVQNLMSIVVTIFVIQGVSNLAEKIGNDDVVSQAKTLLMIIVAIYVLSLIASFIVLIFGGMFISVTAGIIAVVALVLNVIGYIVYLSLLSKGKKMLAE